MSTVYVAAPTNNMIGDLHQYIKYIEYVKDAIDILDKVCGYSHLNCTRTA